MSPSSSSTTTPSPSDQKAFVVRLLEKDEKTLNRLGDDVELARRRLLDQAPDEKVQRKLQDIASHAVELLNKWCKDEPEKSLPPWFKQELDTLTQSKSLQDLEQLQSVLSRTQHVREDKEVVACISLPSAMRDAATTATDLASVPRFFHDLREQDEIEYHIPPAATMFAFHDIKFIGSLHLTFLRAVIDCYEPLYLRTLKLDGTRNEIGAVEENAPGFEPFSYGRVIHVVQSSGTGKSRLINELIKVVPGISVCLREVWATAGGYPFGDDPVTSFLTTPRSQAGRQAAASLFIGFLLRELATTKVVSVDEEHFWNEWLVKKPDVNPFMWTNTEDQRHAKSDAARRCPFALRTRFFRRVVKNAEAELKRLAETNQLLDWVKALNAGWPPHPGSQASDEEPIEALGDVLCDMYCTEPARLLANRINKAKPQPEGSDWDHNFLQKTFFLAIDEASLLAGTSSGYSRPQCVQLTHLRRALFALSSRQTELRIWAVLMDTNLGITLVDKTEPSKRILKYSPLPLWSRLAYDVYATPSDSAMDEFTDTAYLPASEAPQHILPEDLLALRRLSKFGRPLWGYSHSHGSSLVHFACQKLLCAVEFDPRDIHHVVAVWSNRVCLDFVVPDHDYKALGQVQTQGEATDQPEATAATTPQVGDSAGPSSVRNTGTDQASQGLGDRRYDRVLHMVTNGVRAHMRIFLGLRPSGFIDTKLLSEPILTLGAIIALRGFRHGDYTNSLRTLLVQVLERGKLLPCGQIGEFIFRLVLILARDVATPICLTGDRDAPRVSPFPTKDFLKALLGNEFGLATSEAIELERLVGDSVMCFTHFTIADQEIPEPISQHTLRNWFSRTVALQCWQHQAGVDAILPVYYPNTKSYSYLGISAKLSTKPTTPTYKVRCTEERGVLRYKELKHNCWGPKVTLADGSFERPLVILTDLGATTASEGDRVSLWQDSSLSSCTADETRAINDHIAANQLSSTRTDAASPGIHANDAISKETLNNLAAHGEGNECNRGFAVLHAVGFSQTLAVLEHFSDVKTILAKMLNLNVKHQSVIDTYLDELDEGKDVRRMFAP